MKFRTIERRISSNEDGSRFRVQFTKKGKANAKILKTIEEARALRDKTDKKGAAEKASAKKKKMAVNPVPMKKIKMSEIDLGEKPVEVLDKDELLKRHLNIMEKLLGLA